MKSGKQRRAELKTKRKQRKAKQQSLTTRPQPTPRPLETAPVNEDSLALQKLRRARLCYARLLSRRTLSLPRLR